MIQDASQPAAIDEVVNEEMKMGHTWLKELMALLEPKPDSLRQVVLTDVLTIGAINIAISGITPVDLLQGVEDTLKQPANEPVNAASNG